MDHSDPLDMRKLLDRPERAMIDAYFEEGLKGIEALLQVVEERKQAFRLLIKEKTGKNVRKTPKRGNKFTELESRLNAVNIAFDNDERSDGEILSRTNKHWAPPDALKTPTTSKGRVGQGTSISSQLRRVNNDFIQRIDSQNTVEEGVSPVRAFKKKAEPPLHLVYKSSVKKSEMIRQLEAKQKAVISNKEEIIKSKAERVKRDREERAQRVLQNNKKKEEKREANLRAIRQRELELEEIRRHQASPVKGLSRNVSRANSKSPSRLRLVQPVPTRIPIPTAQIQKPKLNPLSQQGIPTPKRNPVKRKPTVGSPAIALKRSSFRAEAGTNCLESIPIAVCVESKPENEKILSESSCDQTSQQKYLANCAKHDEERLSLGSLSCKKTSADAPDSLNHEQEQDDVSRKVVYGEPMLSSYDGENRVKSTVPVQAELKNNPSLEREREEVREKLGLLDSSQLNNKILMNVTSCSSYEMTPPKKPLSSTEENYNIDDLSSGDETDEEDNPKKKIPSWAQPQNLRRTLREQSEVSLQVMDKFFGEIETPDLNKIFSMQRTRYAKRTSSAQWNSPLANPREGVSLFFALQRQK